MHGVSGRLVVLDRLLDQQAVHPWQCSAAAQPAPLHLVRAAGFEVLEERLVEGCEYNALPSYLERTVRTCLFFVARPKAELKVEL